MSSHAGTLPLGAGGTPRSVATAAGGIGGRRAAAAALILIVALSLFVVVMAADRPSVLSPTTHNDFYPHWMAGPLGGLWPGLTGNSNTLKWLFSGALIAMYTGYAVLLRYAPALRARWVIAAILLVHAIFILSPPLALTDLFNYINYGRMEVVHHLNPYTTIPILEPHDDPSYALSNWHELLSPYGPLFTMLTFLVVPLGVAGSFWALKLILAAASLGTLLLVWRSARLLGRDPATAVALVGLNPIVLVWGLGGDHNDFLMVFLIVLGFYLLLLARERSRSLAAAGVRAGGTAEGDVATAGAAAPVGLPPDSGASGGPARDSDAPASPHGLSLALLGAGAALVLAAGLKASAAVLIPVVLAGLLSHRRALLQVVAGMALAGALVAVLSLLAFGLHIPDLSTQSRLVTSESVPNLIGLAIGVGGENEALHHLMSAALVASVLACCWMAWQAGRGGGSGAVEDVDPLERMIAACGWSSVALLVTLSWVLPWYVIWVLPMAALAASRRLRAVSLLLGVYLILAWAPAAGIVWNAIGFHPEKTSLGRLHQRYVRELLN